MAEARIQMECEGCGKTVCGSKRSQWLLGTLGAVCTASLVVVSFCNLGLPLTLYTWVVVTLCAASGATLALSGKRRYYIFPATLVVCVYLAIPHSFQFIPFVQKWGLLDHVGGRSGCEITPGLRFGRDGRNTAILEAYAGPLEPKWVYMGSSSPYERDGDERIHSRNVILYEYFPQILAMLPDDAACQAVIKALTDPENRLRAHQSLLLACLLELHYPAGTDRNSWWLHHKDFFNSEHDPTVAASLTQDWLENIDKIYSDKSTRFNVARQYYAARGQQIGAGGHFDFGDAFIDIKHGRRQVDPRSRELARKIIWWPELQKPIR